MGGGIVAGCCGRGCGCGADAGCGGGCGAEVGCGGGCLRRFLKRPLLN